MPVVSSAKIRRPERAPTARQRVGAAAEAAACDHLVRHGLCIVGRNVRYRAGELDIVAVDGRTVVFVEVRRRSDMRFGGAGTSIDAAKRRRLARAAQCYLLQRFGERWPACRFDVVAFDDDRCEWIIDAFGIEEERA